MSTIQVRHLTVSLEKVAELVRVHRQRYSSMIDAAERGRSGIRIGECRHYLRIWMGIEAKQGQDLSSEEARELYDALMDEDDGEPTEVA